MIRIDVVYALRFDFNPFRVDLDFELFGHSFLYVSEIGIISLHFTDDPIGISGIIGTTFIDCAIFIK